MKAYHVSMEGLVTLCCFLVCRNCEAVLCQSKCQDHKKYTVKWWF